MRPSYIPASKLEAAASQILARHEARYGRIIDPPVPVESVLENTVGLDILWDAIEEPVGDTILAGLDPGKRRVLFNEARRQVFEETPGLYNTVLGHESGHWDVHVDQVALTQPTLAGFSRDYSCLY